MAAVWIEIHFDDEVLASCADAWPDALQLARQVATVADVRGAKLGFRFRTCFARHAQSSGLLPALVAAGHEVGVHAHGKGLAAAVDAVRACGVSPVVAVPGLVQAGIAGRAGLLKQAAGLGIGLVTDHGPTQAWAYEGFAARAECDVQVMAPTVRPFEWGLMTPTFERVGLDASNVGRLRRLEAETRRAGWPWFGAALHEHDLCAPGSLRPRLESLTALGQLLDARVVTASGIERPLPAAATRSRHVPSDPQLLAGRAIRTVFGEVGRVGGPVRRGVGRLRRTRLGAHRLGVRRLPVGDSVVMCRRVGPARPRAHIVVSAAGREGGLRLGLSPFGVDVEQLSARGFAVWLYDRSGTGRSPARSLGGLGPGNPDHVSDWLAALGAARAEGGPVMALSWSAGIIPVLAGLRRGGRVDALVDGEGPVDRWSLVPLGGDAAAEMAARDRWSASDWVAQEAVEMLGGLSSPYARMQGGNDHQHGDMTMHAERAVAAAQKGEARVRPLRILPGRLHHHGNALVETLEWALDPDKRDNPRRLE